jgi:hypothetical protein
MLHLNKTNLSGDTNYSREYGGHINENNLTFVDLRCILISFTLYIKLGIRVRIQLVYDLIKSFSLISFILKSISNSL